MAAREMIKQWYRHYVHPAIQTAKSDPKTGLSALALILVIVGVGGFWMYRSYKESAESQAQDALLSCMLQYQKATQDANAWPSVISMCDANLHAHRTSDIAPFFLILKADALQAQGNTDQAAALTQEAIAQLPASASLTYLYKTKYALMQLDQAGDARQKEAALQMLQKLAQDSKNTVADMALFYVGYALYSDGKKERAQQVWQQLIDTYKTEDQQKMSPWVLYAQAKMGQQAS